MRASRQGVYTFQPILEQANQTTKRRTFDEFLNDQSSFLQKRAEKLNSKR
jgi:hypothetical protein